MKPLPPLRLREWFCIAVVFLLALALRAGYILEATDWGEGSTAWHVQGPGRVRYDEGTMETEEAELIRNIRDHGWFGSRAPYTDEAESTAAISPGFPWFVAQLGRGNWSLSRALLGSNSIFGALTCVFYLLILRRATRSLAVGVVAGFLTSIHPYWLVNAAELSDGTVTSFLVALALFLGMRSSEEGGPFSSLLFGVTLAGLALVRAALLPFAFVSLLWFLVRCRGVKQGWLCAVLAFLGFANGLAPWTVRNWQTFGEPVPVVTSTWLHLWMGNNSLTTGGVLEEDALRLSLKPEATINLMLEANQARRYEMLARHTLDEVIHYPGDALNRRLMAGSVFLLGEPWLRLRALADHVDSSAGEEVAEPPQWMNSYIPGALAGSLICMLVFALIGWRRSAHWRRGMSLLTQAAIWIPLPYLLGHAGILVGPRLPLDGVWLSFAALGLAGILGLGPLEREESAA